MNIELRPDGFLHRRVDVGEVTLHLAEARPKAVDARAEHVPADVPLVVFLHGFPEYWGSWRRQLRAFSAAGLWAVAPDMRGYNESDKPRGVSAYDVDALVRDVAGLIRALGRERAIVVGHDWGAIVAWNFANARPELVEKLAILNVPHPSVMLEGLLRRPLQMLKSWYVFFFQLPFVPERVLAARDFASVRLGFENDGFPSEDIQGYVDALRAPGAVTSAIHYYRAVMRRVFRGATPQMSRIETPVLVIWGDRDRYLGKEMAEPPPDLVPNARVVHLPNATHWVQNDAPVEVNRLLLEFIAPERLSSVVVHPEGSGAA